MSDNELIMEENLLKDANLLLKKKISLNDLNNIFVNIIQNQYYLFKNIVEEKSQYIEKVLNQIIQNENLLFEKFLKISLKSKKKKRKQEIFFSSKNRIKQIKSLLNDIINTVIPNSFQIYSNDQDILKIYWRSCSSNNTHLNNNINKFPFFDSSLPYQWNFPKLEKIKRHSIII
ncbi:unnamed protein product [Adineta steineri]|uniref:Uncharacterized protein n=1 Tax=Adineta steineri TaxID=433720 RepID=A0A814FFX5_9BILA|nr:unnamed protein product [Adineta steineri]CAF0982317.1 unnamed protein product [Adineta steineri]CAF3500240.1 unnamed protein product [Adineta steineri]CAF3512499.1 unnamed protein product [Adineta steineri]